MGLLRAFIAIEIPHHIQQSLDAATSQLRSEIWDAVRWVPAANIHLTLKFLGDVSPASVEALIDILRAEADSVPAFDIHVGGLGSFPSLRRARVLWVGVQAPAGMESLSHGIESACARLGYGSEARDFSPHLTLGRVRQDATPADAQKIRRALEAAKIDSLGTARVDSVHLFKSELKKSGAVYTKLFSAHLKNPVVE